MERNINGFVKAMNNGIGEYVIGEEIFLKFDEVIQVAVREWETGEACYDVYITYGSNSGTIKQVQLTIQRGYITGVKGEIRIHQIETLNKILGNVVNR